MINFKDLHEVEQDGKKYTLQEGRIPRRSPFWGLWRKADDETKKRVHIKYKWENGVKQWYVYRLLAYNNQPNGTFANTYSLRSTKYLLPYQYKAVQLICNSIINNGSAIDGSDCGIGKTFHAVKSCLELGLRPGIVCKKAGIATWVKVCAYMQVKPLFIINWEMIRTGKYPVVTRKRDEWDGSYTFTWHMPGNSLLIFDEAHVATGEDSLNSALYEASKGLTTLSISATFADKPIKLQSLFYLLDIMGKDEFKQYLRDRGILKSRDKYVSLTPVEDMVFMHRRLYPKYGCRLTYKDSGVKKFFPSVVYQLQMIALSKNNTMKQNRAFNYLVEKVKHLSGQASNMEKMALELRYRQMAELLKVPVLIELIQTYRQQGLSVCVFVNYRDTLFQLAKKLNTKSVIMGEQYRTFGVYRNEVIDDFQKNVTNLVLCMSSAGGQSLDLHDLSGSHQRISLICPTYNAIELKQVLGRTFRSGAKSTPIIKLIYALETIEEKVSSRVLDKIKNIDALNDGDLEPQALFT